MVLDILNFMEELIHYEESKKMFNDSKNKYGKIINYDDFGPAWAEGAYLK